MILSSRPALRAAALIAVSLGTAFAAHAQNLLTNNADFESGFAFFTPGGQTNTEINPGWVTTSDTASFSGVGDNQPDSGGNGPISGKQGIRFGYIAGGNATTSGTALAETAAGARAAVSAGTSYTLSFLAGVDFGTPTDFQVGIVWYNQNSTYTPLETAVTSFAVGGKPLANYSRTLIAPVGATFAAARFVSTGNNSGHLYDDVRLTAGAVAVPEAGTLALLGVGASLLGAGVIGRRK